ncbi:MAG TPA: phosphoglucosamine mutase [Solirubrobacteraceae bacterium]|jgi:phosphoglucosamine mutase|nr:phosphoglucosamine mutase [Solirubrobacteraceae bacterium]
MTPRLFGTDGVRGVAGELLSAELALALGKAVTARSPAQRPRVLIVRDTRESGEMLQSALAAGVSAAGGEALLGGVLPTPAAPLLLGRYGFDLAAVLSASHNPYQDNGIKFFAADGFKLSDEQEQTIEEELREAGISAGPTDVGGGQTAVGRAGGERLGATHVGDPPTGATAKTPTPPARAGGVSKIGHVRELRGTHEDYLRELESRFCSLRLDGLDVLLDCANGATYKVAPEIFRRLGADVTVVAASPDGRNINEACGSTHIAALGEQVRSGGHALGLAFDGDGDRVLAVDRTGAVVDGDELIALAALHLRDQGRLAGEGVVVTVMTNYGFHSAMREAGIEVACTNVGDRYVLEQLRSSGWALGGEQSGHIIEMGFNSTGDGIAGALLTLEALGGRDLSEREAMHKLPQRLVNVRVVDRSAFAGSESVARAVTDEEEALAGRGRVLVRPSGTEPLVRVMVEAPSEEEADAVCSRLVTLVQHELG